MPSLRIMQANKLTLERHTARRPGRTHDGVVIALRSNVRWCSDHFELACPNGEIIRVRSPESNGIAEAFVKTFKRDCARLSILPDAAIVIALLPAWFEDYNEVHPHSGLKFLSPREFLRLSA
jgi:transposase InsO family protein